MLPFIDTFRTLCMDPPEGVGAVLNAVEAFATAA